ncbi:MAG: hypothetical protein ACREFY_11905, partial [Acetobacteraceae bacterium]
PQARAPVSASMAMSACARLPSATTRRAVAICPRRAATVRLFARLADPDHHREAITTRPLLLTAIGRQTSHAGRTTIHLGSSHAKHPGARQALARIGPFLEALRSTTEQSAPLERWYTRLPMESGDSMLTRNKYTSQR